MASLSSKRKHNANDRHFNDSSPAKDEKLGDAQYIEHAVTQQSTVIDPQIDKRLCHRFDRRILPWLFGLWLLAFIDRSNIANAKIDGLSEDLKLDANKYNISLAIFYVPYIIIDVPSNWLVKYIGAGFYLPMLLISWGICSLCTGFVTNFSGLLAVRFFLGLSEGGLLGGVILYLSMFYTRRQLLRRIAYFYCAAPLSGAFGGLLATGLAEIRTKSYKRWPFIFFVEGAITVVFGILATIFLPHTPGHANFLSKEEQEVASKRMQLDSAGATKEQDVEEEKFNWHWVRMAVLNWNTLGLSLNFFLIITPIYSFSLFLPTLIQALGYNSVKAQLLTVPPNFGGFITVLITGFVSDRVGVRGPLMIVGLVIALAGYIMLIATNDILINYGGTFLVAAGIFPTSPLVMGWLSNNLAPHYVRATGTGFQIGVANLAAFIATFTYLQKDAPHYKTGHAINIGVIAAGIVLTIVLMLYQIGENKKRKAGVRDARLGDGDEDMEGLLGYRHPAFEYTI